MRHEEPPRPATRLLEDFGPQNNREALAGDLLESFQQGRSRAWYWRQVLAAISWRRQFFIVFLFTVLAGYLASLDFHTGSAAWLADWTALDGLFVLSGWLPVLLSGRQRACLALLIVAFALLHPYLAGYIVPAHFPWYFLLLSLIFHRKPEARFSMFIAGLSLPPTLAPAPSTGFLAMATICSFYLGLVYFRTRFSGMQKACFFLLSMVCGFFLLLFGEHFPVFLLVSLLTFFFPERLRPSRPITCRQLLRGDRHDERQRMIAKLEETMDEEQNPELRQAYGAAIARIHEENPAPPGIA